MKSRDPYKKLLLPEDLQTWRDLIRGNGDRLVFTNGCFDILHPGHALYLREAAELGDVMIVAINSDASTRRLKGPGRPIQSQFDRALVLASLECVDYVCFFEEDTPAQIIHMILPDVLVKGGDYELEHIVGAEEVLSYGGQVKSLKFHDGFSTSEIERKIRNHGNAAEGTD